MSTDTPTGAQRDMLRIVRRFAGEELGAIVMECASVYDGGLAWRIADRTAGALLRRGWIQLEGDIVQITDAGLAVLSDIDSAKKERPS